MEYEGRICRGPMERASYMLPVSVGCAYNACRFCMLFKHLRCRELPLHQIEAELQRVSSLGGAPKVVYLGDGNAFHLPTERLVHILELIARYLPSCQAVHMDATVTDIAQKTDAELALLYAHGVRRLYLGIESGLEDVLISMNKDHTIAQADAAISRIRAQGYVYGAHIMTGVAGKGRGLENATALAAFLNRNPPAAIINFSMFIHKRAPLWADIEAGRFTPADEVENMMEERRLLELLETDGLDYDGFHDKIEIRVRGRLPEKREIMLTKLDAAIEVYRREKPVVAVVE